jgi:pimeloyl-ACP methyl ester carboxylesterase
MASKTPQKTLLEYTEAMRDRPDCLEVIQRFHGPILFIAGEKDAGIPVEGMKEQAALARRASLYTFNDVGHMGMLENEKETLAKVVEFIQKAV